MSQGPLEHELPPSKAPTRSHAVTRRLRPIKLEDRAQLAKASEKDPYELTASLAELEQIEVHSLPSSGPQRSTLRVAAWNAQRGRHWERAAHLIRSHPALTHASILLLNEMDLGMARSANEHTARRMATSLGMSYAYAVEFLELTNGEREEQIQFPEPNEWGYHGNAILSRFPLSAVRMLRFPGIEKWFGSEQNRLGGRMALFAEVQVLGRAITLVCTHFETGDEPSDRDRRRSQFRLVLDELAPGSSTSPVVLGGDFNARPQEELLADLRQAGFSVEESNDLTLPTRRRSRDGTTERIDYICTRGLQVVTSATSPAVISAVDTASEDSPVLSDHALVTIEARPC